MLAFKTDIGLKLTEWPHSALSRQFPKSVTGVTGFPTLPRKGKR